jgi:hypothetical protein
MVTLGEVITISIVASLLVTLAVGLLAAGLGR